ncbi:histidine kinase [Kibdelosporangium philippinense]|uniref:histidine kinase n=1 Tax=Kibdelosporangium philippinense TaxID=211113 RepID=A0ABS8ZFP2_9PSEU|nr:histidine kinase [Kibdelosporangium philippinense]MCE7006645.1 histidine kinase [Kibdelosporangium philippinense]
MVHTWLDQFFDRRAVPLRLAVLVAVAGSYFLAFETPTVLDVVFVAGAVLAMAAGPRWPLAVVVAQAGLLAVAPAGASHLALKVLAGIALFELAMRRSGWPLAVAVALMTAVYALYRPDDLPGLVFRAVMAIGGPILLGTYVRSVRRLAQVEVRTSVARELHDLVAHHVSSIVLRVKAARKVLAPQDPQVREVLDDVHDSGVAALADLRQLVTVLRDPTQSFVEPGSLPAAVEAAVARARKVGLRVNASVDPALAQLDATRSLTVLRLTQEGLANVAKHAGSAARTRLSTSVTADAVRLEIRDDGGDFRVAGDGTGHGLVGLRERVEMLGGTLEAGADGQGWRLLAVMPVVS